MINVASKRRTRLDLYFDILQSLKTGNYRVTQIMREVNVAYKPLKEMLATLLQHRIVEEVDADHLNDGRTSVYYRLTTKGESVYAYLRNTKNHVNEIISMLS